MFAGRRLKQLNKIEGHLSLKEGRLLCKVAKSLRRHSVVVEIGAFFGKSTCFIAEGLSGKQAQFFTIDTWYNDTMPRGWADVFAEFLENTRPYHDRMTTLRGFSYQLVKDWPQERKIDFLFVDGDHSYEGVKTDIRDWLPFVKKNGVVCFHDYRDFPGVIKAVDETMASGAIRFVKKVGSVYMARHN